MIVTMIVSIKKYCSTCKYETKVIPNDSNCCSGCGGGYVSVQNESDDNTQSEQRRL